VFRARAPRWAAAKLFLQNSRLLTLTGPGGIGKTRLSLQIAAESARDFAGGGYFVALSAVRDPVFIASVVAQVLGIPIAGSRMPMEGVADHVRDKTILFVLDNFE